MDAFGPNTRHYSTGTRTTHSSISSGHKEAIPLKNLHNLPIFLFIFSIVSFPIAVAYAAEDSSRADTSLESKLEQLMTSVYCHCGCTRETIRQCVCGVAQQIESKFRGRLAAGQTVEQLRNEYIAVWNAVFRGDAGRRV